LAPRLRRIWSALIRPKGHLDRRTRIVLTVLACLPLLVMASRALAAAGAPWSDKPLFVLEPLRAFGGFANRYLTFAWAPPSTQTTVAYLLLLPMGALLVALFRLTLGIRVLGLRAILLAVGFQVVGLFASLALMLVVIGAILLARPWMRRIQLPLYARLTFILSVCATIMLGASLAAPWLHSEALWRVAFFPVIIMAMVAEAVAKTLEQDNAVTAVWRGGWTVLLALLIVLIDGPIAYLGYQLPELLLTQLVAIIVVAEFIDWRLLEDWPDRIAARIAGGHPASARRPKLVIVGNRDGGTPHVPALDAALRAQGFDVAVVEGDAGTLSEVTRRLRRDPRQGTLGGIVFNAATMGSGEGGLAQVPALLEMGRIPYTGPGPLAQALLADRFALLTALARVEVPVPRHALLDALDSDAAIGFPASVRPRGEPEVRRIIARNDRVLRRAVRMIRRKYGKPAVVEGLVIGRKISVALLGNEPVECLPLVELEGPGRRTCPAELHPAVADRIRVCAQLAYQTAGCRDYGRVDIRLASGDEPVVVDVKCTGLFARRGTFLMAAEAAGYDFATVMRRIVSEAAQRYVPRVDQAATAPAPARVVSLTESEVAAG
jgi:D-alanine-D-alanine ligase